MKIEKYLHHGAMVSVQSDLKGQHRDHCLCFQGCAKFKLGADDNCEVAEANLANCKQFGTVQPIWECPTFEAKPAPGPRLIGLCGPAGAGKSAAAGFLEAQGFVRLRFAGPLKSMLGILLVDAGARGDLQRYIEGDLKEVPCEYLGGKTPREAMQALGTEWGRLCIGTDFWVRLTLAKAEALLAAGTRVVIEDVRFANEVAAITGSELDNMNGVREVWRIDGRGGISGDHISEGQVFPVDVRLDNTGDLGDLEERVLSALAVAPDVQVKP